LEHYNNVVPNGADRIIAMAESQLQHRQSLEATVVAGNTRAQARGQAMGFTLGLVTIVGGIALIAFNKDAYGLAAIVTAFVGLSGVFVYGRIEQRRERAKKRSELQEPSENPRLPFESDPN